MLRTEIKEITKLYWRIYKIKVNKKTYGVSTVNDSILKELAKLILKFTWKRKKIIVRAKLFRNINYEVFSLIDLKWYCNDTVI